MLFNLHVIGKGLKTGNSVRRAGQDKRDLSVNRHGDTPKDWGFR